MTEEKVLKPYDFIEDYVTGKKTPLIGAEENRQNLERYLVEVKGFAKEEIEVDRPLELMVGGKPYKTQIDLAVRIGGRPLLAARCVAGSLDSREREIVAACRVAEAPPIPLGVVSDGTSARVLDAASGRRIGERLEDIPSRSDAEALLAKGGPAPLDREKVEREKLIFRTYDMEDINVQRKLVKTDPE
jgi:hypothetical protein